MTGGIIAPLGLQIPSHTTSSPPHHTPHPPPFPLGQVVQASFCCFPALSLMLAQKPRFVSHDCVVLQIMLNVVMEGKGGYRASRGFGEEEGGVVHKPTQGMYTSAHTHLRMTHA